MATDEHGWVLHPTPEFKEYKGDEALAILYDLNKFCENGFHKILFQSIFNTDMDNVEKNAFTVTLKDYLRYNDYSGHYEVTIFHPSLPEGCEIHIKTNGDTKTEIFQWSYG